MPFILVPADAMGSVPFVFALTPPRSFLEAFVSDDTLGAASFMTILAWISSNFDALTFLGQKRVTNLKNHDELYEFGLKV